MIFILKNKNSISIKEYDECISHIAKVYFGFTSLNVYIVQANKAVLSYTTSINYHKHSINIGKDELFTESLIYGKHIYKITKHSELSFINAMDCESAYTIPLKHKKQIFGMIMFLYKEKNNKITLVNKLNILLFRKITENIFSHILKTKSSLELKNQIVSNSLKIKIKEYNKARSIQKYLNTVSLPIEKQFAMSAYYMPSEALGGDFFDIRKFSNVLIIIVADSVGNGIEACFDATLLKSISDRHIMILAHKHPEEFLRRVSYDLTGYYRTGFPSMLAIAIDEKEEICYYSNAGMLMPFTLLEDKVKRLPNVEGFLLGYDTNRKYQLGIYKLKDKEMIFIYSDVFDAIITSSYETENTSENIIEKVESFYKNLVSSMDKNPNQNIEYASNMLLTLYNKKHLLDDATFICIKYLKEQHFSFTFKNTDDIEDIEKNILSLMEIYNFDKWDLSCVGTSLWEACNNSLNHSGIKENKHYASVFGYINTAEIFISVSDRGHGFNYKNAMKKERVDLVENIKNNKHNGMGIFLIKNCVDEVVYKTGGSIIEMRKKRSVNKTNFRDAANLKISDVL